MSAARHEVAALLIDLEVVLRDGGCWSDSPPSAEALASDKPFCLDTMQLPQWLQFVFLPRLQLIAGGDGAMPESCATAPMAELWEKENRRKIAGLCDVLLALDAAVTAAQ